ncbi:WD40 repeat-like protein [Multifurca ochricompacta]|uniref:WD40 repeat-like protein n=1 Tax=Multifurca ochricompacta TaxID=376703 RepID=A0AAD4M843_9AGAM|nr:WD40 repeat-like protein [Multifurca ochricompacta]
MSNIKAEINLAHSPGYTTLAFSRDGAFCYTGGDDCIVRLWKTNEGEDQEPPTAIEAGESIMTLATSDKAWFSGSKDSDVRQYKAGDPDMEAVVTSSAAACIRCIAIDPPGKRIAVSSDEPTIKVIDIEDTVNMLILHGHNDVVRKVTWEPSGSFLTSCSADGKIIVWDLTQQEPKQIKLIDGVIPALKDKDSRDFAHDCSAVWHPSGQYFVVGSRTHEIVVISRDSWTKTSTFSSDSLTGVVYALALSPNGVYLASSTHKDVQVWSTQTRRLLFTFPNATTDFVTQLAFSPTKNLLAWADFTGSLYRWSDPIPSSSPSPVDPVATSLVTRPKRRGATPTLFDDDATARKPNEPVKEDTGLGGAEDFENEDWILDDVGDGMEDDLGAPGEDGNALVKEMVSVTKAQPAFQPGSTPMENRKRYLAYNMIGVIEVTDQDTHYIINVEFHDRSARKAYHFTDYFRYDLAALGPRGAVYACQPENEHSAHVVYKPYGNWATQGEWTYELSNTVRVLGIAAGGPAPSKSMRTLSDGDMQGNGNVVVATSDNELTFLSGTGIERCSVALDGDFVSMVAGPEWVFVVQRDGTTTMDGSQNLMGTLYDFEDMCVLQNRKLPIRKGHTLRWIGISEEGAPAVYDSAGVMYLMPRFRIPLRGTWVRILDTERLERKQGKDESYWPVGLSEDTFMCLILKGRQEYPTFPRPLIQELPVRLPFRGKDPKDSPLEEQQVFARESMHLQITRDALGDEEIPDEVLARELALDKELVQLIQTACKRDKLPRALELTRMLHHTSSFDMAMKVAAFYRLVGLREKMQALKDDRVVGDRPQRRDWVRDYDPVRPPRLPPADVQRGEPRAFQDFGPPAVVHRPGLARATLTLPPPPREDLYTRGDDHAPAATLPGESKRKRADEDIVAYGDAAQPDSIKRRAVEDDEYTMPGPPKPRANPFAKKPSDTADGPRNPFAPNKSLHKSESFFDKVEAAETSKWKGLSRSRLCPADGWY